MTNTISMISARAPPAPLAVPQLGTAALIGATNWSRAGARHGLAWLTASNLRESR